MANTSALMKKAEQRKPISPNYTTQSITIMLPEVWELIHQIQGFRSGTWFADIMQGWWEKWGITENWLKATVASLRPHTRTTISNKTKFFSLFLNILHYLLYLFLAALELHCCTWAFSSCGERRLLFIVVWRFVMAVGLPCWEAWALDTWALVVEAWQAQQLQCTGLAALQHVGSSWTKDQTCVLCTGSGLSNTCSFNILNKLAGVS